MFPVGQSEAELKFWQMPELLEGLLVYLDPESTLRLAEAHERTRNILQGTRVWNNLINDEENEEVEEQVVEGDMEHIYWLLKHVSEDQTL